MLTPADLALGEAKLLAALPAPRDVAADPLLEGRRVEDRERLRVRPFRRNDEGARQK